MEEEKGILDDIEEMVDDFQKKKISLNKLSVSEFTDKFIKMDKDLPKYFFKQQYRQECPSEPEYNRKVPYHCRCGMNYTIYINQVEQMIERSYRNDSFDFMYNKYEKSFYCIGCGMKSYISLISNFEIVSIKHDESLKI